MSAPLHAAGLSLPLMQTAAGPRIDPAGEIEGLATAVNAFLNGVIPDLRDRVRAGEDASGGGVYAVQLPESLEPETEGEPWRRLTGEPLGDDPVMVGSSETGRFTLPRDALLEILDGILDLAALQAEHRATTSGLARAVSERTDPPKRAMDLRRLEQRARELEEMQDPGEAAARRRTLLIEMDVARVLPAGGDVEPELRDLPLLASYDAAARRMLAYLASDERRRLLPGARRGDVVGAPVSLDWFRADPAPDFERTAIGEAMLTAADLGDAFAGRFFAQWNGSWYEVVWRRDNGTTPALVGLSAA